jgi:hypothetical protein
MARTPDIDVLAVQQDAALVNALAVRADLDDFPDDHVATLLAAWTASIDAGVDASEPWRLPEPALTPVGAERRSGRGRAGVVAGAVVAALVASGGAAAAVTGDPLAVVRAPIEALERVNPFAGDEDNAKTTLPEPAAPVAEPNKLLASAQRALAQGDLEEAARLLAEAQALLGDTMTPGQERRIDRLLEQLSGEAKGQGQGKPDDAGQGKPDDAGQGKPDDAGQGKPDDAGQGKPGDQGQDKPTQDPADPGSTQTSAEPGGTDRGSEATGPSTENPGSSAGGPGQGN